MPTARHGSERAHGQNGGGTAVDANALVERAQALIAEIEKHDDPAVREVAHALVHAMLELYGEGLQRIFGALNDGGEATAAVRNRLVDDGVVGSLLLIHDLYPVPLETRVLEGLERVRPYMESHGGNVELLGVHEGVAHLRLAGTCNGCAASASTLELAITQALEEVAPDLVGLDVEGVVEPHSATHAAPTSAGKSLPIVDAPSDNTHAAWLTVGDGADRLQPGQMNATEVSNMPLLVANVGGTLLAYRNECAVCAGRLEAGTLTGPTLTCPSCESEFNLTRAGRAEAKDGVQLRPVPLLNDDGTRIKVALAV